MTHKHSISDDLDKSNKSVLSFLEDSEAKMELENKNDRKDENPV